MTLGGGDGREQRFEAIYRKYYGRVWRFYRAQRVPEDEAHDLCQDTFKRLYESFVQYRGEGDWSYVETIARNVLYNAVRARATAKRSAELVAIDDPDFNQEPPAPEEQDYAEREEDELQRRRVRQAIDKLPPGQREAILLWIDDFKYDEIATTLRISMDAVKSRLRDAKRMLRAQLGAGELPEDEP
jgi:RNA polymerase sigma-70 factor (ECF subfamily)